MRVKWLYIATLITVITECLLLSLLTLCNQDSEINKKQQSRLLGQHAKNRILLFWCLLQATVVMAFNLQNRQSQRELLQKQPPNEQETKTITTLISIFHTLILTI